MEIISFSEKSSYSAGIAVPRLRRHTMRTVHEVFRSVHGAFLYGLNNIRAAVKYAWLVPACLFVALVPKGVSYLISQSERSVRSVSFADSSAVVAEFLDGAMNDFANGRNGFDTDGNILSADGSVVSVIENFKQPVTFSTYTVRSGDTISGISAKFGLSNISTLIAVNKIDNVRSLRAGQKLSIPSVDGLIHVVASGESLASVSKKYSVSIEDLLDVNDLSSETIAKGAKLYIPGARLDSTTLRKAMGELFVYPITASWRLTSKFGRRADPFTGVASSHTGIDMACPTGTPIRAAKSGTVAYTGYSSVFGNYVIITHGDGYQTLYGHMSKVLCKKGQSVTQSTRIGLVGNTGYSTGPHLHFTVYKNGKLVDPLTLLK